MIQRIQSVWLAMVSLFSAITFRFPFYTGDWSEDAVPATIALNSDFNDIYAIATVFVAVYAFVNLFLFANRKKQLRVAYLGIILSIAWLALFFIEIADFLNGSTSIWALFYFLVPVFYFLAARGIQKDQKLIKSMDRLR